MVRATIGIVPDANDPDSTHLGSGDSDRPESGNSVDGIRPAADRFSIEGYPSLAELDAIDMAEMARKSRDHDLDPAGDPGPPPNALRQALGLWWVAALAALISVVYGFVRLSAVTDALRNRLEQGVASDPNNAAPVDRIDSLSHWFPPLMLVATVVLMAISYSLLVAIGKHHSRNCRNFYAAVVVVILLCIPVGIDLLFGYPQMSVLIRVVGWVQFGALLASMLCTFRRGVNRWLPESERIRVKQVLRPGDRLR